MNKKKLIPIILIIIIIISIIIFILNKQAYYRKCAKEMLPIYEKVHNIFLTGNGIQFENYQIEDHVLIKDNQTYYKIINYDAIFTDNFTSSNLVEVRKRLNIIVQGDNNYIKPIANGLSNYYGTTLKTVTANKNKMVFKAISQYCSLENQTTYGNFCKNIETLSSDFVIVKEKQIWKVEQFTPFTDIIGEIEKGS